MEIGGSDPLPLLQVILKFTVTEVVVPGMGGGGIFLLLLCIPDGPVEGGQPGSVAQGNVAPYILIELSVLAEAAETALVTSSSDRVS